MYKKESKIKQVIFIYTFRIWLLKEKYKDILKDILDR